MTEILSNLEIFLENNAIISKLHKFIFEESTSNPTTQRIQAFFYYLTALKKELDNLYKVKDVEDRKALCHFYLGELYAKCSKTYHANDKVSASKTAALELTRLKCALIHYINAMLEANRPLRKIPFKIGIRTWRQQKRYIKKLEQNKQKIFLQIILTLTELLQSDPNINIAIDDLYPKARIVMKHYLMRAQKKIYKPFFKNTDIKNILSCHKETIFDKMGIPVRGK